MRAILSSLAKSLNLRVPETRKFFFSVASCRFVFSVPHALRKSVHERKSCDKMQNFTSLTFSGSKKKNEIDEMKKFRTDQQFRRRSRAKIESFRRFQRSVMVFSPKILLVLVGNNFRSSHATCSNFRVSLTNLSFPSRISSNLPNENESQSTGVFRLIPSRSKTQNS